jgi:mannose-6-phosphate isomerase-like protein (cupin superfamily)
MTSIVLKPWGSYEVLQIAKKYTLKRLIVKSGCSLSLQNHEHRSEHWVVVQGKAEVKVNEKKSLLEANEYIYIPLQAKHQLSNNSKEDLIVIEVWFGDILDENDITRYKD